MSEGRYVWRQDRPLWRKAVAFLGGPCWCITHKPSDCKATWRNQ